MAFPAVFASPTVGMISLRPGGPIRCAVSKRHGSGQWLNMGKSHEVKVTNKTAVNVTLKEDNSGLKWVKATLKPDDSTILSLDRNATYREYVLLTMPDNTELKPVLTSDEVAKYEEILILKRDEGEGSEDQEGLPEYYWEGQDTAGAERGILHKLYSKTRGLFHKPKK